MGRTFYDRRVGKTIALIPARGGSKGIPRKNLQRVGGRPLVVRSILHARAANRIDGVYVSTDDDDIAAVAIGAGGEVIRRPENLSGDTASTESAVEHALSELDERGVDVEVVVLLQCTSPFRSGGQLDAALARFESSGCDSLFSGVPFHGFVWKPNNRAPGLEPATYDPARRPRRQEIRDIYLETGSFYVFRRSLFENTGSRMGGHIEVHPVSARDALEIDDPHELERARMGAALHGDADLLGEVGAKWLVLDVDGTLTDAAMYYGEDGSETKRFDTRDGAGIRRWRQSGGKVAFITGENSKAAERRARKLQVDHLVLGAWDKEQALRDLLQREGLSPSDVIAMGDDVNDLPMVDLVGLFVAPGGARPEVMARADLVTTAHGGHGAVRELVELLLRSRRGRS